MEREREGEKKKKKTCGFSFSPFHKYDVSDNDHESAPDPWAPLPPVGVKGVVQGRGKEALTLDKVIR